MSDELQLKVWDRLRAMNLPVSDCCPHCHNEGWITVNVPYTHPAFGKAFACICREDEITNKQSKKLNLRLGLPKKREYCTFEWFDKQPFSMREGKEEARAIADCMAKGQAMASDGIQRPHLALAGDTGMGKSSLAACIGRARIEAGQSTMWLDYKEFNET